MTPTSTIEKVRYCQEKIVEFAAHPHIVTGYAHEALALLSQLLAVADVSESPVPQDEVDDYLSSQPPAVAGKPEPQPTYDTEQQSRIRYQNATYNAMIFVDRINGDSAREGTGCNLDNFPDKIEQAWQKYLDLKRGDPTTDRIASNQEGIIDMFRKARVHAINAIDKGHPQIARDTLRLANAFHPEYPFDGFPEIPSVHVNTRDERGVSQPLPAGAAAAIAEASDKLRAAFSVPSVAVDAIEGAISSVESIGDADCTKARSQLADLLATVAEQKAVIDRLPVSADGKPIVPGMKVYYRRNNGEVHEWQLNPFALSLAISALFDPIDPQLAFSTCAAALAASTATEGKQI